MAPIRYELGQAAYLKLILHAIKHPSKSVNGVLVGPAPHRPGGSAAGSDNSGREEGRPNGEIQGGDDGGAAKLAGLKLSPAGEGEGGVVQIEDAMPLFHLQLGLAPMLEIALTQVEEYLSSEGKGWVIVGYYHANERHEDAELGPIARRIAHHIEERCPLACALLVDNQLLQNAVVGKGSATPAVQLFTSDALKGWRPASSSSGAGAGSGPSLSLREATAGHLLVEYVSERRHHEVVDFDDHFNDVSQDWVNAELFK